MLKLIQNEVPTGNIDWVNKIFKTENIIWAIQSVYVDWTLIKEYSHDNILTITLETAPTTSIVVNYFYRELSPLRWNGEVTLWKLKDDFYRKIGRVNENGTIPANLSKLYPEDYVKEELRKSIKRNGNKSPERTRIQQYSFRSKNWYKVTDETADNSITFEEKVTNEIEGIFMIEEWIIYEYYQLQWNSFQTADVDLTEIGDKIIVGHRIPYGVQKISTVHIDGEPFDYIDERDFNMNLTNVYTIVRDFQWNDYLFLPYSEKVRVHTIRYVPDLWGFSDDNDIVDVPYEYTDLFVYDVAYRLLRDKEDERWIWLKDEIGNGKRQWLLFEYQSFIKSKINKPKAQIGFAKT